MSLPEICIRRPVFALVLNILLILVGVVAWGKLTLREFPDNQVAVINVMTSYPGASAEVVESDITTELEQSLSGIEGVDYMSSRSRAERSQITVYFELGRDADTAAAEVRDRVARARQLLPEEADEPIIAKTEADAEPIIWLAATTDTLNVLELSDIANRMMKDRLQTLPGVAEVQVSGERRWAIRIWLDRLRLAAYGLAVSDVEAAVRNQNIEVPAGRVEGEMVELSIVADTGLRTPEQFRNIIVSEHDGALVRVGDIARVELEAASYQTETRYGGVATVALGIVKQSTANPLEVSRAVQAELSNLRELLPDGVQLTSAWDSTAPIDASIDAVFQTILEAVVLCVLVIFAFLRAMRSAIIPIVTIPISLIGAFSLMWLFGFSINTLTLLALVLAIGIVVDDAIVVLENVHRHIEEGKSPFQAALVGSREITLAVIAMTLTLAAVFAPIAFTEGRTGKLFIEFALTLAGAVLISGFTALTLTPMMCAYLLKRETHTEAGGNSVGSRLHRFSARLERGFDQMATNYARNSRRLVARPLWSVPVLLVIVGLAAWLTVGLPDELAPPDDKGLLYAMSSAPQGSTTDYLLRAIEEVEETVLSTPGVSGMFSNVAGFEPALAGGFITLEPWSQRDRSHTEIAAVISAKLQSIPAVLPFVMLPPPLGQPYGQPVQVVMTSSRSYGELDQLAQAVLADLRQNPAFSYVENDLRLNKPKLDLSINRDLAANSGVEVATIGRTLETLFGSRQVTRFERDARKYDVLLQMPPEQRSSPSDLHEVYVRSNEGELMQLTDLVTLTETVEPRSLNHFNKLRSVVFQATPAPGYSLGEAIGIVEATIRQHDADVGLDYLGTSREYLNSANDIYFTALLAILFIYLVLAAQFESFIDPFIILLSVPFALLGAAGLLHLVGGSLNIYSQIGMIALVGLIAKHGIMLVDVANRLRDAGTDKQSAILEACRQRLRPILMTTAAMVFGAIPLALASGAAAESRQQIGMVIVGGMSLGTVLTLTLLPALYALLSPTRKLRSDQGEEAVDPAIGSAY